MEAAVAAVSHVARFLYQQLYLELGEAENISEFAEARGLNPDVFEHDVVEFSEARRWHLIPGRWMTALITSLGPRPLPEPASLPRPFVETIGARRRALGTWAPWES